jgi:hypothetical protein
MEVDKPEIFLTLRLMFWLSFRGRYGILRVGYARIAPLDGG